MAPTSAERREHSHAFSFWSCSELPESLGVRAESERELLERLESIDADSIYYHSVRSLLRRQVVRSPHPNDFAAWVAEEVRDPVLAERLALQSPFDFDNLEAFREHLLQTLDDHLMRVPFAPRVISGRPFHFLLGHLTEVPLEMTVNDVIGFRRGVAQVDESSIYYHAVESMGRLGNPRSDFAEWVDQGLGEDALARAIDQLDPFTLSLDGLRHQLLQLLDTALAAHGRG